MKFGNTVNVKFSLIFANIKKIMKLSISYCAQCLTQGPEVRVRYSVLSLTFVSPSANP